MLAHLRSDYFHEFGHSIPLGNDYWAHLLESDSYDSFSEIFIQQEYLDYLPVDQVTRILDLGAHYGYFSLWLQSQFPDKELYSLMIEPSTRCRRSLKTLINDPQLDGRFSYLQQVVEVPEKGTTKFYDRPHMAGSRFSSNEEETAIELQTLNETSILECFTHPYDLIKCDIEGSEWEFINYYPRLLKRTQYLLLEWHSWHKGGGGYEQLIDKLRNIEYDILKSSKPITAVGRDGEVGLILARNIKFKA